MRRAAALVLAAAGSATAAPPAPPVVAIAPRPASELAPSLLAARPSRAGRTVATGEWVGAERLIGGIPRLAGQVLLERPGDRRAGMWIDLARGVRSPAYDTVNQVSAPAGAAEVYVSAREAALLRFSDGKLVRPKPIAPDGRALPLDWFAVRPETRRVWVFAVDGQGWRAGRWDDRAAAEVKVPWPLPLRPRGAVAVGDDAVEVYAAEGMPVGAVDEAKPCVRVRLAGDGPPRCVARASTGEPFLPRFGPGLAFAAGAIVDPARGEVTRPPSDGFCRALRGLDQPVRLLLQCDERDADALYLYGLAQWWSWREPRGAHEAIGRWANTVDRYAYRRARLDGPVDTWIDLAEARVVTTAPMQPVSELPRDAPLLAQRRAADALELLRVDPRAATVQVVARYADCAGAVAEYERTGARLLLVCREGGRVRWNEVIDLARGARWRTPLALESLLADGTVLAAVRAGGERRLVVLDLQ